MKKICSVLKKIGRKLAGSKGQQAKIDAAAAAVREATARLRSSTVKLGASMKP